jgi:aminopeptidase N
VLCRAKPVNYHVSLFDLQLGGSWEYKGIIKVDTKITRATKEIVLNSKDITVQSAEVFGQDGM